MSEKTKETTGYLINAFSIALFFYLSFTLNVPDIVHFLKYVGWVLLVFGSGLIVLAIIALVRNQGKGLIEKGIYGVVRHPMYLGAILMYLSFPFFLPHWLLLVIASINIAVVYRFILLGEQQNISKFGDDYRRYEETVPRINLLVGIFRRIQSK